MKKTPEKDVCFQLIEDTKVLCKDDKLIIPLSLVLSCLLALRNTVDLLRVGASYQKVMKSEL